MRPDIVLFDLDGTLTDSGPGIMASVTHALSAMGVDPLDDTRLRGFVGPPLRDSFAALGWDAATVQAAIDAYREYYLRSGMSDNSVYPGIRECLAELRDAGCTLVVATSKPAVMAERIVARFELDEFFTYVCGAELDGRRSVKSEVIAEALGKLNPPRPAGVVMVGDRSHDVIGARKCGLPCVGVAWGYAAAGELRHAGAVAVAATPADLGALLLAGDVPRQEGHTDG
ncbi:MAG TPA: HAD family hydrolase [Mycobacteriales bacterium]|nr:HAD family hydrolase [Mycobacteriales bacterium]